MTAFFIWLQVLLYLKTFERFSHLVRMIFTSLQELYLFLIIFFLGVFLFADTFQAITERLILRGVIIPEE